MTGGVWAVVVARMGGGAKSRLAAALDAADRRRLALAMFSDVLEVVCPPTHDVLDGVVAVVDEPEARWLAVRRGAIVIGDPDPGDMNAAVAAGLAVTLQRGARTAVVLPGDIPLISARDLQTLIRAAGDSERAVVVGASRDGQGTNALLLRPPNVIPPGFGPPSVGRHVAAGQAVGAVTRTESHLGLALDIDTPADLAALADAPVGLHTAELLTELLRDHTASLMR